jgi:Fe-S-cluster containining protein
MEAHMTVKVTHDEIVAEWRRHGEKHEDQNYRFLRELKRRASSHMWKKVDETAARLHTEVFSIIDCKQCANCCRSMHIRITEADIPRISKHLGIKESEFIATYLKRDEDNEYYIKTSPPCPFLKGNLCSIYDVRPEKCRGYPFTDRSDFLFSSMMHANNSSLCPAVFHIVESLRREMRRP